MLKSSSVDIDVALKFLPRLRLFSDLDNKVIDDIAQHLSLRVYEKGDRLLATGEPGKHMLIIKQGRVAVALEEKDIELSEGDVIGEMALLSGTPSKADVVASSAVEAFALERADFQDLAGQHPDLKTVMTSLMKSRMFGPRGINRVGKYKVLEKLGEGGMSVVYNGVDTVLGREVAIKMLKYEIATKEEFKKRFKQEAVTIAKLTHPKILHVIETIDDYSTSFIIMEKLEGFDLKYYLKEQGVFDCKQTCDIISQVALALEYAGSRINGGIIHRDIKPANIVMDYQGNVRLMDFGIATSVGRPSKQFEGTILYTAPEVLQSRPFDYRIDIYALATTAFTMLTGNTPFRAPTLAAVVKQHISTPAPDVREFVADVPEGLAEFIRRGLIKDPEQRISSWKEIQSLLAACKGSKQDLLENTEMDMALVVKLRTAGIDTALLQNEIHQVLKMHHASYELEVIEKEKFDLDFKI